SGWVPSSACFASMVSELFLGRRRRISISLQIGSEACSPLAMELCGLARIKALQAGRMASSRNIRNLQDSMFLNFLRIMKGRYGSLALGRFLPGNCVQFAMAASIATERMEV